MKLKQFIFALVAMLLSFVSPAFAQVAKVGNTEYATIDEAIANWTNNATLTLLADVTLSDVIQLSSTEHHILDLGTYTMTAASRKDAIQIVNNGRSSASYALDIKADATNPGGITASGKAVVKTTGKSGVKDRPIIRFYGGVFNGSNVVSHSGSNGTNCPQFWFYGGEFNGTISANRAKFCFYGGTFNGNLFISVDSSADALVSGGKFKSLSNSYGSTLNPDKFTIGSAAGVYDRGIYVDKDDYYVVTSEVIKEVSAKYPAVKKESYNSNNYFYYSAAAANGMFYEVASMATGSNVTVYEHAEVVEELDNNVAVKDFTPELPSEVVTFEVEAIDVEATTEVTTKVTFNVEPKNASGQKVSNPSAEITFRLPVPAAWSGKANVYHEGTLLGAYTIKEESGANYVEVSSSSFSEFSVEAIVPLFAGEGTEVSPYIIDSSDKLAALRNEVNGGEAYEGVYFKLTSDITLSGEWTAIGNGSRNGTGYTGNAFKGVFDGGNNTISGLTITSTTGAKAAIGLFGVVDGGTVKNLNLTDVNINVASSDLAGAAIGMMLNGATADAITVSGAVVGHDGVGGIVGRLIIDGTIANCTNNASVTSNYGGIGGIVGKAYYDNASNTSIFATIENCTNKGTITAPQYVGGIAGLARANVTNCVNEGEIVGGTHTGGIIGQLIAAGTVSGNENKVKVSGTAQVGGIIGSYSQTTDYHYNNVTIANNINRGEIAATQQYAAILGVNNIDGFTAMTATGNQSFYFIEGLELFGNPEDMVIDATNKFILPTVAIVNGQEFSSFTEALEATKTMTGDVTVEIYDKVTFNQPLIGNYTSINFVGKDTDAEMYLDVQGYTTATGKKVSFTDLKLSKSEGGFIANAGFMNVAFGIYDVEEVTYTNCTFENGACASSGKVTFNGCTFKKSWDKYGLWAYGNVDVTVQGSTFADYRGIKMYAENGAAESVEKANLTVKNTNFSAVDNKPAIVLTYGESVVLEGNTYSSTGTFELDLDGKPNGVAVTSDVTPVCVNDNGACGVLVDGKIYTTVAQAAEVATETSTVTLLHSSNETVEFPMGTTIEKNGFTADNVTTVQPFADYVVLPQDITVNNYKALFGTNTVTDGTNYYATLQAAVEAVAGQANAVLYCKPGADVGSLQHAPVVSTLTIYGNGANVTGGAERDFDLGNTDPSAGKDITADMTLTVKHLNGCGAWGAKATNHTVNLVFENCANMGKVFITGTTGTLNITMTDCAFEGVIKEAVYSNADGAITLNNVAFSNLNKAINLNHKAAGTQTVTINGCSFTNCGADVAADQIPVRVLSSVDGGKSVLNVSNTTFTGTPEGGADILLDYAVGETTASVTATAANVFVEKENNVATKTTVTESEGGEFTNVVPVAKVNGIEYATLAEAITAAQNGETITLIDNVVLAERVTIPADKTLTIDLNGKSISMEESIIATAYAINNLGNLTITDGVGGGSINARGIYNGYGDGAANVATATITVLGGTFNAKGTNGGAAIFNYGTANVNGGKFTSIGGYSLNNQAGASMIIADGVTANNGIYASNATLVVNGGEINGNRSGCHVLYAWNSVVTINGGTFYNYNSGNSTIMAAGTTKLTIKDGTFGIANGKSTNGWTSCLIDATDGGKYEINGGEFKGHFRVQANCAMEINGGTFENTHGEAYVNGGTVAVKGGTFTDAAAQKFATDNLAAGYELGANGAVGKASVAEVNGVKYASFAEAAAAAQAGSEIKLLANIEGDITVPANVTLNGNGFAISGGIFAEGDITFAGVTKAADFDANVVNTAINIPAGASLQLTGSARLVIGHGATFNITGTIEDAKTADKATLVPSLKIAAGASITGNGVTFNVNNAYIVANANTTSKNSNANGTLDFNINNSIWDQTGVLAFYVPTSGKDPVVNFELKNSVLTTTSHLVFSVTKGEVVIDNSNVNVGKSNQIENRSTMTIKNGSVVNGAVATSSNAINPGTIIVENATYAVTGEFSGAAEGTGTLIIKKGANVSVGSIKAGANVTVDAEGMAAGDEINFTANLSQFTGTLSVINNDKLEASIVDGKVVLAAKPVAKIGEQGYATLEAAFAAATEGQTITLLDDATPALTSQRAITKAAVIDLGGKTMTLKEDDLYFGTTTFKNGTIVVDPSVKPSTAVFWMFANQTLTFDNVKVVATGVTGTYLIGLEGDNSDLNLLNGSEILVENTTALDLDIICVNGTNTCDINVENSKVNVTNLDGRVFFRGNYTVKDSEVNLAGITKAGFRIEAGQTLSIEGTSEVNIEGEPRDGGIHLTDASANYTKAETANVNATVNEPKVAKIGETTYKTLQAAIEAVQEGETIILVDNVNVTTPAYGQNALNHARAINFTLDLNGKTLSANTGNSVFRFNIANSGATSNVTLTIKNGKIVAGSNTWCAVMASGISSDIKAIMNLEDLTIEASKAGDLAVKAWDNATINAKEVTVNTTKAAGGFYAVGGEIILDDCTVNQKGLHTAPYLSMAFAVSTNGKMTINSGTYSAEPTAAAEGDNQGSTHGSWVGGVMNSGGELIINGGTFSNGNFGDDALATAARGLIFADSNGKVTVNGGTFNALKSIFDFQNNLGTTSPVITVKGGNYSADPAVVTSYGSIVLEKGYYVVENNNVWTVERGLAGAGTEAEPYLINNVSDLKFFRDEVNKGVANKYNDPDVWVALGADIDLSGENWVGIGSATADHGFMGNFDGKNFKIKNLTITDPTLDSDGYAYAGLFGVTEGTDKDNQNTIKNLTIENVTISTTGDIVSAAIAYPYYTNVDNVKVCGDIKIQGGNYTAGVLAYTRRCVNASNLSIVGNDGSFVKGNQTVGGVISDIQMNGGLTAVYSNFSAEGITVIGEKSVGGIAGIIATQTLNGVTVKNVTLNSSDARVGIVAGCLGGTSTISNVTYENVTGAATLIGASYDNAKAVAAKIGDTYYATLEAALAAQGNEVELLVPYVVAKGETVTLDLNGKTISQTKECTASYEMICNKGNLTITGNGKISFTDTSAGDPNFGWGSYTVRNEGNLVVENGTIEHLGTQTFGTHCIMALYQYAGSTTINGGTISTPNYRSARLWKGNMTINGGTFDGQVWAQAVDNSANLVINGGTFEPNGNDASAVFVTNNQYDVQFAVTDGTFNGKVGCSDATKLAGAITGGKFNETAKNSTNSALLATGSIFGAVADANGYFAIEDDPTTHYIANLDDLKAFRDAVNNGTNYYADVNVYLAADIDMTGENWVGIGTATKEHGFMGNFDGQGYKIKNLTITDPTLDSDGYAYAGLFGVTEGTDKDNQNTIKNLTIENVTISTTGDIVSAAIAYPYYTIVDNVKVCGDINIQGGNYTAGVLAYTRRCVNASNLSIVGNDGSFVKGNQTVGGVISDIQMNGGLTAVYSNFSAEGITVTGEKSVGGIAGIIATQTLNGATVKNVTLNSSDARVGIVAGCLGGTSTISNVTYENVTGAATLIGASYDNAKAVAAKIGDTYYATLEAALAAQGNEVELLATYEVAAGETKTLDLKGKTVTMVYTAKATKNHTMINNSGNLTIESSVEGGKLSYTYAGENIGTSYSVNTVTSNPGSVLTVKSGTIENLTYDKSVIAYAIDGLTNGGAGDVTVNIEGGVITSKRQAVRIFANSTTNTGALNISGGEFTGRVIVQNANANANKAVLNITAGTFNANEYKSDVLYVGGSSSATIDINASVSGGTFNGEITETNVAGFITGGTYKTDVNQFCALGYQAQANAEGLYAVEYTGKVAEFTIVDGEYTEFNIEEDVEVGTLTYTRTIYEGWNALYVPFEIPVNELTNDFEVAYINDMHWVDKNDDFTMQTSEMTMEVIKIKNGTLKANHPYIIRPKNGAEIAMNLELNDVILHKTSEKVDVEFSSAYVEYKVSGTYTKAGVDILNNGNDIYIVSGDNFGVMNNAYPLPAFRIFMTVENKEGSPVIIDQSAPIRIRVAGEKDEATGIITPIIEGDVHVNDGTVYDLMGRPVRTPEKGKIYIMNGKKVLF